MLIRASDGKGVVYQARNAWDSLLMILSYIFLFSYPIRVIYCLQERSLNGDDQYAWKAAVHGWQKTNRNYIWSGISWCFSTRWQKGKKPGFFNPHFSMRRNDTNNQFGIFLKNAWTNLAEEKGTCNTWTPLECGPCDTAVWENPSF